MSLTIDWITASTFIFRHFLFFRHHKIFITILLDQKTKLLLFIFRPSLRAHFDWLKSFGEKERETKRERDKERERQRERDKERETKRERDKERETKRETKRERETKTTTDKYKKDRKKVLFASNLDQLKQVLFL